MSFGIQQDTAAYAGVTTADICYRRVRGPADAWFCAVLSFIASGFAASGLAASVFAGCGGNAHAGNNAGAEVVAAGREASAGAAVQPPGGRGANAGSSSGGAAAAAYPIQNAPPATIACGAAQCDTPANIAGNLLQAVTGLNAVPEPVPCCVDEDRGICGSASAIGVACDALVVSDPACPGVDLSALATLVGGLGSKGTSARIGCCTRGKCGLDGFLFGRGCVENTEAKNVLGMVPLIGPLISVPPPAACGDDTTDAGI